MKLSEYAKRYEGFTEKASNCARKLAFAGIALIWIYKIEVKSVPKIPQELVFPLILLALTLALDLLQYIMASFVWWAFYCYKERKLYKEGKLDDPSADPEFDAPAWMPWLQDVLFIFKLCTIISAYLLIILYAWGTLINKAS